MSDILARLASLSPQQRARLMSRLAAGPEPGSGSVPQPGPESPAPTGPVPVAPAQARLWLLQSLDPGSPAHHLVAGLALDGPLDADALGRVLTEITRRHEPLRTAFPAVDGTPVQHIAPPRTVDVPLADLRALPDGERDPRAVELAVRAGRRPFDLERGPLARFLLVRLADERHLLVLAAHHLVADGWSFGVFTEEFTALYEAFSAGRPSPLPPLHRPYRAVVGQDEAPAERLAHWTKLLGTELPVLALPTDRPRPATHTTNGRRHGFALSGDLSAAVRKAAQDTGTTVYSRLLTALAVALGRLTGQDDLVIGAPVSGRTTPAAEGLIGFFVNTLALRIDLSAADTLADAARLTDAVVRGGLAHQDTPFDRLVHALNPPRHPDRPLLRQVAFAFQPVPVRTRRAGALAVRPLAPDEIDLGVSPLDLSLHMWEDGEGLRGCFEYNTDLFEPASAARWTETFRAVLDQTVAAPATPLRSAGALAAEGRTVESNLTESQLLLYFGRELTPGVRLYYEYVTALFTIRADVDADRFHRAWQRLVDHTDALRSTLHETDGVPYLRVRAHMPAPLDRVDLSGAPQPRAAARDWAVRRSTPDLDLGERVFDSALLTLGRGRVAWYVHVHHSMSDAWSMSLLLRRLSEYYEQDGTGRPDAPRPPSFEEYARHERERRATPAYRRAKRHWEERLARPAGRLGFYGRESAAGTTRTVRISRDLGAGRSARIAAFARAEGFTTEATVFGAALFALLRRLGAPRLVRVGTPFAGRPAAFRDTFGLFMNVLPLEVEFDGDEDFRTLARKVQRGFLQAARYQDHPVRNPAHAPVYDVYLNYQNAAFSGFGGPVEAEIIGTGHSRDRLALQVRDFAGEGRYVLDFDFNEGHFDEDQRRRTVGHYLNLLDGLLDDPGRPVDRAPLLSADELRYLAGLNDTARAYDLTAPLHVLVARQARRTPDAVAVVFEDRRLSYAELDAAAGRLARRLLREGAGAAGTVVGVFMERSLELVVALLAVLKAGGAYLPLDPAHPPDRLRFMLGDAGVGLVLSRPALVERLPGTPARVLPVPAADLLTRDTADEPPEHGEYRGAGPGDPAYAIYTSGSTGTPKCAVLTHRAIVNRLLWMQEEYGLTAADRVLQKTPYTFDVSVWEFFWPLMTGARLVVARPDGHKDPAYLVDVVNREGITTLHFVPSMLRVFLEAPDVRTCTGITRVVCSGEALPPDVVRRFNDTLPAELHNLYGPTEAGVDVSYWAVERTAADTAVVPIGRPVANTALHVLDERLQLLPPGIPGELHIGGVQLATGYLGRPGLTAERFVPSPLPGAGPGERLYRTGDLVRHLPNGALEYLGRIDGQVKLRGFRVELGEVEAALTSHPAVSAAAAGVWDGRLAAYVVPTGDPPDAAELKAHAGRWLPEHMVPSAVLVLPRLPTTANGKLDRRALPEPRQAAAATRFTAPRTPLEAAVAAVWAEVLGRDGIGVHDDFFALGGHSLLAARLVTAAERRFGVRLPLAALFRAPTVARFAALVGGGVSTSAPGSPLLVPVHGGGAPGVHAPLFAFHPAGGDVMVYRQLGALLGTRGLVGVQSRAQTGADEHTSLAEMAAEYAAAVRGHQPAGPYHLMGWSMGGTTAVNVAALLEAAGEEVAFVGLLDSSVPTDDEHDPLLVPAVALAGAVPDLRVDGAALDTLREKLRGLPLAARLAGLRSWARSQGLLSDDVPLDVFRRQADLAQQHEQLVLGHRPPVVEAPLSVWWAETRLHRRRTDWRAHTRGPVHEETIPGNHFTMLRPPHAAVAAARLLAALDQVTHRAPRDRTPREGRTPA
ncbi:hypothetical protein GCM10018793_67110 [Streptomyces sulfonofaciens]|uniref:Carrier domain-containing protein n=1 Tax=Streptomyces sulfonofaciens TaxID=68272 RepID=A0A919GQ92_9ACTN|nr:non-ribosomal peptide synthetase [Streptomyces sulfonofaciens]GHH88233.1 hypothetical protein GCM10018793_67110 [Streptomyces sulfonofaciens]